MSAARKDRDAEIVELLRAIRQELAVSRAPRSGPITVATAGGILGCSRSVVFDLLGDGTLKRWPKKLGRETMVDAASVWATQGAPKVAPKSRRPTREGAAEAAAIGKIKVD